MSLIEIVDHELKRKGFLKTSVSWWRERKDTVDVVQLQKSLYGNSSYINCGICLKTKPPKSMRYGDMEIISRADFSTSPDMEKQKLYQSGFKNFGLTLQESNDVRSALHDCFQMVFQHSESLESVASAISSGKFKKFGIKKEILDAINKL